MRIEYESRIYTFDLLFFQTTYHLFSFLTVYQTLHLLLYYIYAFMQQL